MRRDPVVCALPGCHKLVEQAPSGRLRQYCSPVHRKMAHSQRRDRATPKPAQSAKSAQSARVPAVAAKSETKNEAANGAANGATSRAVSEAARATPRDAPRTTAYRRLVPEPEPPWFHRPFTRRLRRAPYVQPPLPTEPDWLRPMGTPAPVSPPEHPAQPAAPPTGPAASTPNERATGPAAWTPKETAVGPPRKSLLERREEQRARRRAERARRKEAAAVERREAAALLRGTPVPSAGRRAAAAANPKAVAGQVREALIAALHSLANNRLRSLLTTTGIIAGVAAVIVLVALGDGMKADFNDEFSRLANQITVTPAKGAVPDGREPRDLTDRDVQALSDFRAAPHIAELSPAVVASVTVAAGQAKSKASLVGASENYLRLLDRNTSAGRWFTPGEINNGTRGVVLGPEAVNLLWGHGVSDQEVIGETVRLSTTNFKVQGVLETNGQDDNLAIVPLNAARTSLVGDNGGKLDLVIVKSTTVEAIDKATNEVIDILDERHNIKSPTSRDFNVKTFTDWIEKSSQSIKLLAMFIVAVAAISLFVGGVGVANIMLVSVTERTREIGIRKAVGAKTTAILRQFLFEAVVLTGLGGVGGIAFGIGLALLGAKIMPDIDPELPVPILSLGPVLIAFVVSLVIGLLAGGYPAHRAARMRPIQALRFE